MKVLVSGWTKYPHSYAIVNVYQIIALSRNKNIQLFLSEEPPYNSEWKQINDLTDLILTKDETDVLNNIPRYDPLQKECKDIDLIYRITYPYCISTHHENPHLPVALFFTSEYQILKNEHFIGGTVKDSIDKCMSHQVYPVTPSNWSALSMRKYNYIPRVIPHGVDTTKFFPYSESERRICKKDLLENSGIIKDATASGKSADDYFIFLSIGAMTGNKNIIGMIKAWYRLTLLHDGVCLFLKGIGNLYSCQKYINDAVRELKKCGIIDKEHWKKVRDKLVYIDDMYGYKELCELYNSADCYLSPYIAEGFNIPVLEAAACGLPLVVSKGGSTDDFVLQTFCKHPVTVPFRTDKEEQILVADDTSLQEEMMSVISDTEFRTEARTAGPLHVLQKFTWDIVSDRLMAFFEAVLNDNKDYKAATDPNRRPTLL